jgi:Fuc2NAc and GlcNAc transferase
MVPIVGYDDSMTAILVVAGAVLILSWVLTARVRSYALAHSILDLPNERSSHIVPTPRGGGLAIVLSSLIAIVSLALTGSIHRDTATALVGGGILIGAIGWLDDHGGVPASRRALVHFLAAVWAVYWIGGLPSLWLGANQAPLGLVGSLLAVLGIVWATNFYNFMDGIDGIAGVEAVSAGIVGGCLRLMESQKGLAACAFVIAGASAGFLAWNWPPARIFMGDVGSGFLGYSFATLAVASERAGSVPIVVWVILLGVFVFDATVTLARRAMRGERVYAAHRNHAYQRAVRAGRSHRFVSTGVLLANAGLAALALLAVRQPRLALLCLAVAAIALWLVYRFIEATHPMRD